MYINGKNITTYEEYQQLRGEDLVAFMATQSPEDIAEFKAFCAAPKYTNKDGEVVERATSFFEIRNWVLDRYAPDLRKPAPKAKGKTLLDAIAEL